MLGYNWLIEYAIFEKKYIFEPCGMRFTWDLIIANFGDFSLICDKRPWSPHFLLFAIIKSRENKLPPTKIPQKFTPSIFTLLNFNEISSNSVTKTTKWLPFFYTFKYCTWNPRKIIPTSKVWNPNSRKFFSRNLKNPKSAKLNSQKILLPHHSRLRDMMGQSYPIYACTSAYHAHYLSVHVTFCSSSKHTYLSNNWEKTWQVESVEHIEQYHKKFGDKSHHLKRRGRKAFVELLFSWS